MSIEYQGCFSEALKAYQEMNPPKSTSELGRKLGIPDDYNKKDCDLDENE